MQKLEETRSVQPGKKNIVMPKGFLYPLIKVVLDYVLGSLALLIFSPVFVVLFMMIKLDSPGPAIYDGLRLGKNGRLFKCYKFRSMYVNNERLLEDYLNQNEDKRLEWETYHKLTDDVRLTPIGRFIRATSLDELPQLWNVLKGDMSLIGPRPYLPEERAAMGEAYDTIMLAKPGITGYWQVNGRSSVDFATRLEMDCWYIEHCHLWTDIAILYKTLWVVFYRKGAK